MASFEPAIKVVLVHEGGWVNHPSDPGGETNFGWSMQNILALKLTKEQLGIPNWDPGCLRHMTIDTAKALYKTYYWDKGGYAAIADQTVATKVFDCGINCGPKRAHAMAQRAANKLGGQLTVDGLLGPKSFSEINECDPHGYLQAYAEQMQNYYIDLATRVPKLQVFLKNWLHRAAWGV